MFAAGEYRVKITPLGATPPVATTSAATTAVDRVECERSRATHSPDFASVNWFGSLYCFGGAIQRRVIAALWAAWENGTPDMLERTVLQEAESDSANLRMLFRDSGAWGTLIQRSSLHGGPVGCYRLVER